MDKEKEKITVGIKKKGEEKFESSLRPKSLEEFVGQEKLKENLRIFIQAARERGDALDHCLFHSPPGLGKTTLAHIIANQMGAGIKSTSGPVLERVGDLAALLTDLEPGDVFFIDEIHRLNRMVEESLYPVMEDFKLDIIIGQGPHARNMKLDIAPFTLVGATTRAGLLTSPLRERFGIVGYLNFYSGEELKRIVLRSAGILNIDISAEGAHEIASCSRGTPRVANRLLKRVRDFVQVKVGGGITKDAAKDGLKALDVDSLGLDDMDRRILLTIIEKFSGGPVGIETLTVAIQEEVDTLTDIYEPFLIQAGLLTRTSRGRVATERAYQHLKIKKKSKPQSDLF